MLLFINTVRVYIWFTAFECVANGNPLNIPTTITAKYVQFAEEIVNTSYTQSEKFSSVSKWYKVFFLPNTADRQGEVTTRLLRRVQVQNHPI